MTANDRSLSGLPTFLHLQSAWVLEILLFVGVSFEMAEGNQDRESKKWRIEN